MALDYWKGKLPHLLGLAFALAFTAALLSILNVHPSAVAFLCLVTALCVLLPLLGEGARKVHYYRRSLGRLDALDRKFLFCEVMEEPSFWEGVLFHQAMGTVNKSMNDAIAAAEREAREYREYVETWVHEIKTPIASARLVLENHPGETGEALEDALFQIENYVEQALFYARSGAVDRDYLVKAASLRELASAALRRCSRALIGEGFHIELGELDTVVYTDPKWVEFILGQLLSNSAKYHGPRPALSFSQRVEADRVVLILRDNGPGIPESDLPRVFDKGFTGKNGRETASRSTGLGLYLCRKLCRRLGLRITLSCPGGGGTQAELTFPKGKFHLAE